MSGGAHVRRVWLCPYSVSVMYVTFVNASASSCLEKTVMGRQGDGANLGALYDLTRLRNIPKALPILSGDELIHELILLLKRLDRVKGPSVSSRGRRPITRSSIFLQASSKGG